jgi:S-DNA-T family DNA segregation ATPase FtsK/SpoIIIE
VQGAYISTDETEKVVGWHANRGSGVTSGEPDIFEQLDAESDTQDVEGNRADEDRDALFRQAAELCIQHQGGSTSLLQRRLGVGYGRAARIIDQLHDAGILGPPNGSKPRDVLIQLHQVDEYR